MNRNYKDHKIASAMAGSTGTPGSGYTAIWIGIALYDDGVFEVRAKYGHGSNQGYLQENESLDTKARGTDLKAAMEEIRPDVMEWDCNISAAERRAALRDALIEAQDWIEENYTKEERVKRLQGLLEAAQAA